MKKKILSFFCAVILACVFMVPTAFSALAETTEYGPGFTKTNASDTDETEHETTTAMKGESLGMFSTTGYCNCEQCSGGHNLTYSGTVPQPMHTLSADITHFPIGTKLMIGEVVYTVEDMGSAVTGNTVDIYYGSHDEALAHGRRFQEVFTVIDAHETAEHPETE